MTTNSTSAKIYILFKEESILLKCPGNRDKIRGSFIFNSVHTFTRDIR